MISELQLCLAKEQDFESFFALKSEAVNVLWSGFTSPPLRDHLFEHFKNALKSQTRKVYLLKQEGQSLGYLYIDLCEEPGIVEFAYAVSQHHSGQGLAKHMIKMGLSLCDETQTTQIAWIADTNVASIKCAESLGFIRTKDFEYRQLKQFSEQVKFYRYCRKTL